MDNRTVIGNRINSALAFSNKKQKELAAHLGVPDNTISYFCKGKRVPNAGQIIEISKFLGVSSDYLLGLTENATNDTDLQAVCEYTGLSDKAILTIKEYVYSIIDSNAFTPEDKVDELFYYVLNTVLCSYDFYNILHYFGNMQIYNKQNFLATLKENFFEYLEDKYDIFLSVPNDCYHGETTIDLVRYKITKEIERISDLFDGRLKIDQLNNKELLNFSGYTKQEFQKIIENSIQTAIKKEKDITEFGNIEIIKLLSSSDEISKLIDEILEIPENFRLLIKNKRIRLMNEMEAEQNGKHNPSEK